ADPSVHILLDVARRADGVPRPAAGGGSGMAANANGWTLLAKGSDEWCCGARQLMGCRSGSVMGISEPDWALSPARWAAPSSKGDGVVVLGLDVGCRPRAGTGVAITFESVMRLADQGDDVAGELEAACRVEDGDVRRQEQLGV